MAILLSCIWLLGFIISLILTIRFVTILVAAGVMMVRESFSRSRGGTIL